jgi:hypothetical protein
MGGILVSLLLDRWEYQLFSLRGFCASQIQQSPQWPEEKHRNLISIMTNDTAESEAGEIYGGGTTAKPMEFTLWFLLKLIRRNLIRAVFIQKNKRPVIDSHYSRDVPSSRRLTLGFLPEVLHAVELF